MTTSTVEAMPIAPPVSARRTGPRWERGGVLGLLAGSLVLFGWGLAHAGTNSYYAAAVLAGTQDLKAMFFGSLDAANAITVDKPPLALWLQVISTRAFGFGTWQMLLPQVLAGAGSVWLLYLAVRRWAGPAAGLAAGALLALTPISAVMFRYDNPDAVLVLLLVAAAYCLVRGVDSGRTRWLVAVGVLIGCAFLAKMLQAYLVVPGFALVWLVAAPGSWRRRVGQLAAAALALIVASGWWVAVVELWPAGSRPYIGGSTDNSVLDLIWGYNGLARITGGAGGGPGGFGDAPGLLRLFDNRFAGQVSWFLPLAGAALLGGLWLTARAPRTDRHRAALLLWGSWTAVHAAVFSGMSGVIHPYYTVALAPGVAALAAVGTQVLWSRRTEVVPAVLLAVGVGGTAVWAYVLLGRTPDFVPWLRGVVLVAGHVAAAGLLAGALLHGRRGNRVAVVTALVAVLAVAAGPAAYCVQSAASPTGGPNPTAGPELAGVSGPGGTTALAERLAQPPAGRGGTTEPGDLWYTPNAALTAYLAAHRGGARWVAATFSANAAAPIQLATGAPALAIGGFTGTDPSPTLAQFQAWAAAGEVRYVVTGGGRGRGVSSTILTWVTAHGTLVDPAQVGGATVYAVG
jgi:4-amino-4-deoxy-L-arabinose transferase-like glycosyltransferase